MRWPRLKCVSLLAVMALFITCSTVLAGTVPNTLNYQGTLYDNTAQPVNGLKDMTVSLYDVASGGTAFWTEVQPGIIVKNGNFSLLLGKTPNLINQAYLTGITYIGIKVGSDPEMVPRQQFTSVAYALKSGDSGGGVPIGAIIMWSGAINLIPAGWTLCDGTNGTPNLRDQFIVGAGSKYSVGASGGEATHTLIEDEMPRHTHIQNPHTHGMQNDNNSIRHDNDPFKRVGGSLYDVNTGPATATNQYTGNGMPHNNLPPYYALAFIMRVQ
jgi:microcystin-dependent protein